MHNGTPARFDNTDRNIGTDMDTGSRTGTGPVPERVAPVMAVLVAPAGPAGFHLP